jgi:two-component system sensor histidine kinase KdpD
LTLRRPGLIRSTSLAHANAAEGSRHKKRQLARRRGKLPSRRNTTPPSPFSIPESPNDTLQSPASPCAREFVPDSILDLATEVKLIDVPPDESLLPSAFKRVR